MVTVIDGRLSIIEEETDDIEEEEIDMFAGSGPFVLKPMNDFSSLNPEGFDISMAKPVLVPARLHRVKVC